MEQAAAAQNYWRKWDNGDGYRPGSLTLILHSVMESAAHNII